MINSPDQNKHLETLQTELQQISTGDFEQLVASLLSELLRVGVSVAKSGFQHGADAGTAGRQGRNLRIECKRYQDTTPLKDRELLGEVDHALNRDSALEAWILASTRDVPEQLENDLFKKALDVGLPIIIIDWKKDCFNPMAALCCVSPELVARKVSAKAASAVNFLSNAAGKPILQLQKDLESWHIGYQSLLKSSRTKLFEIWNDERESLAYFGQNVAGGSGDAIGRENISLSMDSWWANNSDVPLGILGLEGVGKTWAATSWLVENNQELPIVILIPSSTSSKLNQVTESSIIEFISERLASFTACRRGAEYWFKRTQFLLDRPIEEGPAFVLFFDGLNQISSVDWISVFQKLQGKRFLDKVKVVFSTRNSHFESRLNRFQSLISPPTFIQVNNYGDLPGGEFDQKLAQVGMQRNDIPLELHEMARNPRLFNLVVKLKSKLDDLTLITVHRVLWEYGKDSVGIRANRSFNELEWQDWLRTLAAKIMQGDREFSLNQISETAAGSHLSASDVYARLSEIVDGNFTIKDEHSNKFQFRPEIVAHALGLTLLSDLLRFNEDSFEAIESRLNSWLDPISGLDERSDALRAAVSILIEKNNDKYLRLTGVLLTAWLQSQNLPDSHIEEVINQSKHLCEPLLDVIEHSNSHSQNSPRNWAIHAIRSIPRNDRLSYEAIIERSVRWLKITSLNKRPVSLTSEASEKHRHERILNLIGDDTAGERNVLGKQLTFVDEYYDHVCNSIPSLIEGFPLIEALSIFEMAAITHCIQHRGRLINNLTWLVQLNQVDPIETIESLRKLSDEIKDRERERGVNKFLQNRIAASVLFFSPEESDEIEAATLNNGFDSQWSYEDDYLADPTRSLYGPERRHAADVLKAKDISLMNRVRSTKDFLLDPAFEVPAEFVTEVEELGISFEVSKVDSSRSRTAEDLDLELLEVALARCSPLTLSQLTCDRLNQLKDSTSDARYIRSIKLNEQFLLAGPTQKESIRQLREVGQKMENEDEWHIASLLMMVELHGKPALEQAELILQANVQTILVSLELVLNPLTIQDAEMLVRKYGNRDKDQIYILLFLLNKTDVTESEYLWNWMVEKASEGDPVMQQEAYECLFESNIIKFGSYLDSTDWHWNPDSKDIANVFGTLALVRATLDSAFEEISPRLAPWMLLEAVRIRGCTSDEIEHATLLINEIVRNPNENIPDLGSDVIVNLSQRSKYHENFQFKLRDSVNPEESLDFDHDKRRQRFRNAINVAVERIAQARKNGFRFYLYNFSLSDIEILVTSQSKYVIDWLDGLEDASPVFRRQVMVNGGFYYVLCEALLKLDPNLGAILWTKLWGMCVTINYYNEAGVDSLTHMLFRVPKSTVVDELRIKLLEPSHSNTDEKLFNVAIAATYNNQSQWLEEVIENDRESSTAWKRRRSIFLSGFKINNDLNLQNAWPDRLLITSYEKSRFKSRQRQLLEAIAAYYWKRYISAENSTDAHAAWILFLNSADRRSWGLFKDIYELASQSEFQQTKFLNWKLNNSTLRNAMKKREDKFDKTYLGFDLPDGLGHWLN